MRLAVLEKEMHAKHKTVPFTVAREIKHLGPGIGMRAPARAASGIIGQSNQIRTDTIEV
jgi:hypothetical protein